MMMTLIALILTLCLSGVDDRLRNFVENWCLDCHQGTRAKADLDLEILLERIDRGDRPDSLWRMLTRLERGDMPPPDWDQPPSESLQSVIEQLHAMKAGLAEGPSPPTIARRLNRFEYVNTVQDLTGVQLDPFESLPVDEIGSGFDNSGDVLSVNPLLLEKYLLLAEKITREALPRPGELSSEVVRYEGDRLVGSGKVRPRGSSWFFSSRGSVDVDLDVPLSGDYLIRLRCAADQAGPEDARFVVRHDSKVVGRFEVDAPDRRPVEFEIPISLDSGVARCSVSFVNDYFAPESTDPSERDRNLSLDWIELVGPIRAAYPSSFQKRMAALHGVPDSPRALRAWLGELLTSAWRRDGRPGELDALVALAGQEEGSWNQVEIALTALLVHPNFLFRIEPEDFELARSATSSERPLTGFEIASRLSYFLWSTMPDAELMTAARDGALDTTAGRAIQIERMLESPKSEALSRHFATQWLQIRTLDQKLPAAELFPEVDPELLSSMDAETRRFFDELVRDDLPVDRLLDAEWSWLDERLAVHYGIEGVTGDAFRKVVVDSPSNGAGLLRHGSVLLATSNPTRTSPVKRGKWVLEALLDDAPPPPPPGISGLPEDGGVAPDATLRELLERHRADPNCAACHIRMDALGFALESFDAVGRQRLVDGLGRPIDDLGELPDGTVLDGVSGIRDALLKGEIHSEFMRSLARHLTTYALGRGLDPRDDAVIDQITVSFKKRPTIRTLVHEIAESRLFLFRPSPADAMMDGRSTE